MNFLHQPKNSGRKTPRESLIEDKCAKGKTFVMKNGVVAKRFAIPGDFYEVNFPKFSNFPSKFRQGLEDE